VLVRTWIVNHRAIHTILAEWRALERDLVTSGDDGIAARLAALRLEYAAAVASREMTAEELSKPPGYRRDHAFE
jgi:hypothetical protein